MERTNHDRVGAEQLAKTLAFGQSQLPKAEAHACRVSLREYQKARDHLKRAERDLGETAAFIISALTTATAIQAVIAFVEDKLQLSTEILRLAFLSYITIFFLLFLLGAVRISSAIQRRAKAEKEIDQTKRLMFDFCSQDQLPKFE